MLDDHASDNRGVGTPLYLAPGATRRPSASIQSDIYALGVLLFYLSTGTFLDRPVSAGEIANAHSARRYRRLGDLRRALPHELVTAIERALAPAPKDRYDTAKDFASALHAASPMRGGATATASFSLLAAGLLVAVSVLLWTARQAVEAPADTPQTARRLELLTDADFRASPDGKFILYAENDYLWKWDVDSGQSHRVTHQSLKSGPGGSYVAAVTSANGQLIAYARRTSDGGQLLSVMTADARRERTILTAVPTPRPVPIEWSRDGQHVLCWLEHDAGRVDLSLVRVATGATRSLQTFRTRPFGAALSPDNRFVVFDQPVGPDARKRTCSSHPRPAVRRGHWRPIRPPMRGPSGPRPAGPYCSRASAPAFWRNGWWVCATACRTVSRSWWLASLPAPSPSRSVTMVHSFYELLTSDIDVYVRDVDLVGAQRHGAPQRVDPEVTGGHSLPAWSRGYGRYLSYITSRTFSDEALTTLNPADGRRHEVPVLLAGHGPFVRWSPDSRCLAMPGADTSNRRGDLCVDSKSGVVEPLWLAPDRQPLADFEWTADGSSLVLFQPGQGIRVASTFRRCGYTAGADGSRRPAIDRPGAARARRSCTGIHCLEG